MILSIVIPTYNGQKFILRCLNSIVRNFNKCKDCVEIIVINDGSQDNTVSEIHKCKFRNLKIISKTNNGVSSARNTGIKNSKGKFIWFVDSDDYLPNFDGRQLIRKLSNIQNIDMFLFGFEKKISKHVKRIVINKEEEILNHELFIENFSQIFKENEFNVPWNRIIRRSLITDNNIRFDTQMKVGEDAVFNCQLIKHINKIYIFNKALYVYNLFYSKQIKKYNPELRFNLLKLNNALHDLVKSQNINKYFFENKYERMNYTLLANLVQRSNNYFEFKKQLKNELLPYEKVDFFKLNKKAKIFCLLVKIDWLGYFWAKK